MKRLKYLRNYSGQDIPQSMIQPEKLKHGCVLVDPHS